MVQHVAPETPYEIGEALQRAGVDIDTRRVYSGDELPPAVESYHAIVVMGGPMSAAHDTGFPTRRQEVALLSDAITVGIPVLGVCLGAQLLAVASGGRVYPGETGPEIGWAPVQLSPEAVDDPLFGGLPEVLNVLHWHGDTFDLPPGAVLLASSPRYDNQAFRIGSNAWGLQFHLEVDDDAVSSFLRSFGDEAAAAGVDPELIRKMTPDAVRDLRQVRTRACERFAALVTSTC